MPPPPPSSGSRISENSEHSSPARSPNVFSDEYAASVSDLYSDSLHPRSPRQSATPTSPESSASPTSPEDLRQSVSAEPVPRSSTVASDAGHRPSVSHIRQSIRKDPTEQFLNERRNRASTGAPIRNSTHSASSFAGSQILGGPSDGPSHPYGMYPQDLGVSRSASLATAAQSRPGSQLPVPRVPAHPYGLYAQNINGDGADVNRVNAIPVGFPGAQSQFHRRIGPDGEEQDIVGPDGHAEQLPPYSRYPEDSDSKQLTALPAIGENSNPDPSTARNNSSGGNSVDTGNAPSDRHLSPQANVPANAESQQSNEVPWNEKSWKERRKAKLCGAPLWLCLLLIGVVVLIVVICGAIIGGVLGAKAHREHEAENDYESGSKPHLSTPSAQATAVTQLYDASAYASTPTGLPPVPTGTFNSRIGPPALNYSGCLNKNPQAWCCDLWQNSMNITIDNSNNTPKMSIAPGTNDRHFGVQVPKVSTTNMRMVKDEQYPEFGPALQFQVLYGKSIVLPEFAFEFYPDKKRKRGMMPSHFDKNTPFEVNGQSNVDQAWFCLWPDTLLEGFLYLNTSSAKLVTSLVSSSTPTATVMDGATGYGEAKAPGMQMKRDMASATPQAYATGSKDSIPQRVKLEERRITAEKGMNVPICMKNQFVNTQWQAMLDASGYLINVTIDEKPPPKPTPYAAVDNVVRRDVWGLEERQMNSIDQMPVCYCQWNNWSN